MARVVNSRIRLLLLATLVVFGALLAREAWIATVRAAPLAAMATAQTKATVTLPAGRGTIFDAVGTPLALGEQATTVYADPHQVRNAKTEGAVAAKVLGLKPGPIESALADKSLGFVYVERKAPTDKATPRRVRLECSRSRARARRESTVPRGQPRDRAASSTVLPWK